MLGNVQQFCESTGLIIDTGDNDMQPGVLSFGSDWNSIAISMSRLDEAYREFNSNHFFPQDLICKTVDTVNYTAQNPGEAFYTYGFRICRTPYVNNTEKTYRDVEVTIIVLESLEKDVVGVETKMMLSEAIALWLTHRHKRIGIILTVNSTMLEFDYDYISTLCNVDSLISKPDNVVIPPLPVPHQQT
jgi:hypothetical protein